MSVNLDTMANKVKTDLLVCRACPVKWAREDSPVKEASPAFQDLLVFPEVKALPVLKETLAHPEDPELQVKRDPTAPSVLLDHKVFEAHRELPAHEENPVCQVYPELMACLDLPVTLELPDLKVTLEAQEHR
jgi:hypothetical protein